MSNKNFKNFTKRQTHKRRSKEAARRELMRAVEATGVSYDALKLGYALDEGRRGRRSDKLHSDEEICRGVFSTSRGGYAFVSAEGLERDVFIHAGKTGAALDGDTVEIAYYTYTDGRGESHTDGRVLKVVAQGRKTLIGRVEEDYVRYGRRYRRVYLLVPDDHKISSRHEIIELLDASVGDKVECEILRDGSPHPPVRVINNFGDAYSREANYEAILREEGIVTEFSPEELSAAETMASEPISYEGRVRRDAEIIFSIDGAGAKDLDDAVSIRRLPGGGFRLGVYIADVAHYVRERTPLDRAVMARGTSIYFTDKVVPMLPPALSNGACSLNAGEEKYALGAIIDLDSLGNIKKLSLEECVIKSRVRGVYSEVNEILAGSADKDLSQKYAPVRESLKKMAELYEILKKKSTLRGAIEFDENEAEIILDKSGEVVDILRRERGLSERIIEQFMLTANEAVATYLSEHEVPCVYRVHEAPPPERLSDFVDYIHSLGFDARVISKNEPTPEDFQRLLNLAKERGLSESVSYNMLRAMAKAKYSEECRGHFGLGIEKYCHFTSPIRRLSDLATHRIIKRVILGGKRAELYSGYARRAAAAATEGELRAVGAERRIENLYKTLYMSRFIGEEFPASVASVTAFGLFLELSNTCEGLVPISEMPGMFVFDEKTLSLRSHRELYRTADKVLARLEEADVVRGKLRFSIVKRI